jgi:hypothetical protein
MRNITMQMGRLLAFDKSIFPTCDDGDRHLKQPVLFLESVGATVDVRREDASEWNKGVMSHRCSTGSPVTAFGASLSRALSGCP